LTCRFDVPGAGNWRVLVVNGSVHVSESKDAADTVITVPEDLLLQLARGEQNMTAAVLSGRIDVAGDLAAGERLTRAVIRS
jgi:putative sterol carrier protein